MYPSAIGDFSPFLVVGVGRGGGAGAHLNLSAPEWIISGSIYMHVLNMDILAWISADSRKI